MKAGDRFTLPGVYEADKRSRLRRLIDWLLRRPSPVRALAVFTVSDDA